MKKILFILLVMIAASTNGFAQDKDSAKHQQVDIKISIDNKKDSLKNNTVTPSDPVCKICNSEKVKGIQWVLVFLPTIFFLLLFYYFMTWLKKDGYKISDALSSPDPLTLIQQTKDATGNITGTVEDQVMQRSSSRFIAFLTALTAMVIGLGFTTYYIFITLADCPNPELDDLWKVIAALGIGIIPYGANMWKESKKDN